VVVRDEDVGDPVDLERVEVVENGAGAEVDEHRLPPSAECVDVARVAETEDARDRVDG
jgi:hypothetical protein